MVAPGARKSDDARTGDDLVKVGEDLTGAGKGPDAVTQIQRGTFLRSPLAKPSPVTMPMRAHIICTAPINGHVTTEVQSRPVPSCAPAIE